MLEYLLVGGVPETQGGIKLHTLYDLKTSIPTFVLITSAKVNDMRAMDYLDYESGSFYNYWKKILFV